MASHPDLPALQEQVHALRVKSAWRSFAGNDLPRVMQCYLDTHAIGKRSVSPRRKPSSKKKQKLTHESDILPVVLPHELQSWGCNTSADGFRTTSFNTPLSFCTKGGVKVSVYPLVDRRFAYKASFEITHDVNGRPTRPVKVLCPSLRTARDKFDVGDAVRNSMRIIAFNMYVRVMSRMRRNMLMDEMLDIDTELRFNPGCPIADAHIPTGVVQAYFPVEKTVCTVVQELCALNGIHYLDPDILFNEGSNSSDSSTDSSTDSTESK